MVSKKTVLGSTSFAIADLVANVHQLVGDSWPLSNNVFVDLRMAFTPVSMPLEKSTLQLEPLRIALERSVYFAGECVQGVTFVGATKVTFMHF